jgi:hypothetical protein
VCWIVSAAENDDTTDYTTSCHGDRRKVGVIIGTIRIVRILDILLARPQKRICEIANL